MGGVAFPAVTILDSRMNPAKHSESAACQLAEMGFFSLLQPHRSWCWLVELMIFYIKILLAAGLLYMPCVAGPIFYEEVGQEGGGSLEYL